MEEPPQRILPSKPLDDGVHQGLLLRKWRGGFSLSGGVGCRSLIGMGGFLHKGFVERRLQNPVYPKADDPHGKRRCEQEQQRQRGGQAAQGNQPDDEGQKQDEQQGEEYRGQPVLHHGPEHQPNAETPGANVRQAGPAGRQQGQGFHGTPDADNGRDAQAHDDANHYLATDFLRKREHVTHRGRDGIEGSGACRGQQHHDADVDKNSLPRMSQACAGLARHGKCRPKNVDAQPDGQHHAPQRSGRVPVEPPAERQGGAGRQRRQDRGHRRGNRQYRPQRRHCSNHIRGAQAADGQGELAHLRHGHPDARRIRWAATRENRADGIGRNLAEHEHRHHHQGRYDVVTEGVVIDEHTYGQEKERSEQIPDRTDQPRHALCGLRVADHDTDEEGSGGGGQPQRGGAKGHQEAESQAGQQERLVGVGTR